MQVCNFTTPAQYFHALRRQVHRGYRKPLIIMTPKSLLNLEQAVSKTEDFTQSRFYEILDDEDANTDAVERIVLCSGKVYYDLAKYRAGKEHHQHGASSASSSSTRSTPRRSSASSSVTARRRNSSGARKSRKTWAHGPFILPRLLNLFPGYIHYAGRPEQREPGRRIAGRQQRTAGRAGQAGLRSVIAQAPTFHERRSHSPNSRRIHHLRRHFRLAQEGR